MSSTAAVPLAFNLGAPEILLIVLVLLLLFGATKLPQLARGSGQALRIFKAETKGLIDDDEDEKKPGDDEHRPADAPHQIDSQRSTEPADPQQTGAEQHRSETDR